MSRTPSGRRPRVVVAGLGDTGVLTAVHLSRHVDVVGVTSKPGLVSGQELGMRLTRPVEWQRDYRIGFGRFRGLDRAEIVHGTLEVADLDARTVRVHRADGSGTDLPYDALVIATGVTNGFWRRPGLQTPDDVDADLARAHERLAAAGSIAVVGGGAAAVSTALNAALAWPRTRVDLYFPREQALTQHHRRVWDAVSARLHDAGVGLHPGHRAVVPDDFDGELTAGPVAFASDQEPAEADVVVWTIGRVSPNTAWLPDDVLDDDGFVRVEPTLMLPGHPGVFAVGDVAATDPLRTSARNQGHLVAARNVRAHLTGGALRSYTPPKRRWGSVLGPQRDGLTVFAPNGRGFRIPRWSVNSLLQPVIVRQGIYRGVRRG